MTDNEDEGVGQVELVETLRHTEIDIDLWDDDQPETPPADAQEPETTHKLPAPPANSFADLTQEELLVLKDNLHLYPKHKQIQILEILDVLAERKKAKRRRENLLDFIRYVDPDYKVGKHHKKLATLLEDMAFGRKDRVMVNIAPRFGKSQLTSIYFPAWFVGNFPHKNIIMVSHTSDLAVEFGRKVRNIVDSEAYRDTFPGVALAADSKAAGRWATNSGGSYYACGIGGALAGRGSDLLCLAGSSTVISKTHGKVRADFIKVGDKIWGFAGFETVEKVFRSESAKEVTIDGTILTPNHPVWTFNRGWVTAGSLTTDDLLDTISLWSYIRLYGEIWYGQAHDTWSQLFKGLQHLGADAPTLHKSKGGKLHILRWARNKVLRAMDKVRELPGRYGVSSRRDVHAGQNTPGWGLHQRELSMGGPGDPSVQSAQWRQNNCLWTDPIAITMGEEGRKNQGRDTPPNIRDGYGAGAGVKVRKDELGAAPRKADEFGWLKRSAFRLLGGSWQKNWDQAGIVMGCLKAASRSKICGLLLGVRRLTKIEHRCGSSTSFVNFQVSDSNTFYCNAWMSHNCIDDPHNEQEVLSGNYEVFERAYDWYAYGARTRLSPTGVVAIVATRWAENDLTGKLIQDMTRNPGSDQWEVVEFPAILDVEEEVKDENGISNGYTRLVQKSLWPEQWSLESLLRTKASMPPFQWSAQYMQQPTSKDSAIVKREWWQKWEAEEPPACEYVIMSLDAAAEKNNRSDYTSLSTWGVFYKENEEGTTVANIILLNAIKARWEFPELKRRAYQEYREWKPDWFLVEKKSAGVALYQEMRAAGIPVQEVTPTRYSGDKVARLNSVCDIFSSGLVWYPAGRRWAEDLVDEVCGFPAMPQDDQVDTCVYSLMRFRSGGFITLPTDRYDEDEPEFRPRRPAYY